MKANKMYSVRYFGKNGSAYSTAVGYKGRLVSYKKARSIVSRLKKSGVDAVAAPVMVTAA